MDNILLVFLNNLKDIEGFNKIIDEFDKREYKMYLYDNIKSEDFDFSQLPDIVEYYKNQYNDANKIVILSNLRDLVFAWYRCYNSVVDDFVYFADEEENNYFDVSDRHFDFYYNLYEFNGIESETVESKMYLTRTNTVILPIFYSQIFFESFCNYNFTEKYPKQNLNKKYSYNNYEYIFTSKTNAHTEDVKIGKINKRIVFIKGQSQYDVLRIATDYRVEFFKELGFEVDIIDLLIDNLEDINNKLIRQKPDFVYSFNCIGIDINLKDGRNLYDTLDIPFYGRLGDHPVNQLSRILNSPNKTQFICIDEENIRYFGKYFPTKYIKKDSKLGVLSKNYKEKRFNDRSIDILFAGTLVAPIDLKNSWLSMDKKSKAIVSEITEVIIENNIVMDLDDEMSKLFNKYMVTDKSIDYRAYIHSCIERYIRYYKRYELVKKLGESGIRMVVIGNAERYNELNKSDCFLIKDKVSYQELLDLFNDSKIVINMTGHLYNGVTERILSAMINGAAVVTERDNFTKDNFINKENIILYNLTNFSNTIQDIKYYLNNIEELNILAKKGQDLVFKEYNFRDTQIGIYRMMREFNLHS